MKGHIRWRKCPFFLELEILWNGKAGAKRFMKKSIAVIVVMILLCINTAPLLAQLSTPPKREFRGAWVATVSNIDWPSQPGLTVTQQKAQLLTILNELKAMGINAVFLQVRPECDALYESGIEPWSYWLTGKQGQPPSPFYDPLQFAIEEAHKRGMELHAWINPFRAVNKVGTFTLDSSHVSIRHPDWILSYKKSGGGTLVLLNPGLPQVRDYITSVIMDIVRRYDVDGIHFDDYFYPYEGTTTQDTATFRLYNRGMSDTADWRRDNVNLFVKEVYDSIQTVKPWVKFGISPFGIWKNGVPAGTTGTDAYSVLYADAMAWLRQNIVDYVAPQLYWPNGGAQDYAKLMTWWADSAANYGRDIYIGQAAYRIPKWTAGEIEHQLNQNRTNNEVQGSIFFSTNSLTGNFGNFADSLTQNYYRYPALIPQMTWKDMISPNPPQGLQYAGGSPAGANLSWKVPVKASDGDTASRYVIYRFDHSNITAAEIDSARNILLVTDTSSSAPPIPAGSGPYYYAVTALDRNWNESPASAVVPVYSPQAPLLAFPSDNFINARDTTVLQWQPSNLTASYSLEVSADSAFSKAPLVRQSGVTRDSFAVTGMEGMQKYYWRVSASNAGGTSNFSGTWSLTTGFPISPILVAPSNALTNVPLLPKFTWHSRDNATQYRLQVTRGGDFTSPVIDTILTADTSFAAVDSLMGNAIYGWRVSARNDYGFSLWSDTLKFRTLVPTWVAPTGELASEYDLMQNYPNPFNPSTAISYKLSAFSPVTLKVYDILGREVATLVNQNQNPGNYTVVFDASRLPSGVYFYRLTAGTYTATKKMMVVK